MPLTIELVSKRPSNVEVEAEEISAKWKVGQSVCIEYFDTPQSRTPSKANGIISRSYSNGTNFSYSVIPEGFHKAITDIPEEDVFEPTK